MPGCCPATLAVCIAQYKPLQFQHLKDIKAVDLREYHLKDSTSSIKGWIRSNWDNLVKCTKMNGPVFKGKRNFVACGYNHHGLLLRWKG